MDLIAYAREHTPRLQQSEELGRLRQPLRRRPVPRHRRLASGHQCHTSLHAQIRRTGARRPTALSGPRADAHALDDSEPPGRDRPLCAAALLGADHRLPRHHVHGGRGQVRHRGEGAARALRGEGQGPHDRQDNAQGGPRSAAAPVRPHDAAGGVQQTALADRRQDAADSPEPL